VSIEFEFSPKNKWQQHIGVVPMPIAPLRSGFLLLTATAIPRARNPAAEAKYAVFA
jgi:hypothetical protein